ncbi:NAD(P)-dependent alcohol dehydrogenase [Cupriavidus consociatus]|uniref:NAD(P)-dependent alcohol dehydrogenase n=1 Tax=Cupriavidus consociatus TaxID=2821357 RepID=UPI001AE711EC|nr:MULTISPECIES: NAD(P)-dependent alcohol dehydrogenase [unclassified Cupriavidus]MBP0623164.1 NAD(P)-dependent alcohol dehydrogenase [Cupriavidus sp. LEh25]MDK2659858.1 NAD(P)-dependent alcohol dehydrogenase [Cupriavidus sp. LEh21]
MQILAAIATSPETPFTIEECELSEPGPGEVLVAVHACGICHTDIAAKLRHIPVPLPKVLGHEGAGVVERVGPGVTTLAPGDHVVMTFGSCGVCEHCHDGHPSYCEEFTSINFAGKRNAGEAIQRGGAAIGGGFFAQSAFATYALARERNAIRIDRDLPLHLMAPLGCGILTGIGTVLRVLKPCAGTSLVVFGAGAVGLGAVMAAKLAGCTTIIAVDIKEGRLQKALELGATHMIQGDQLDAVAQIISITGTGAHFSVDTTGVPDVVAQSIACLRKRGTTAHVALSSSKDGYKLAPNIFVGRGLQVRGVVEGDAVPSSLIPQMVAFYRAGVLPLEKIVQTFRFDQINEAMHAIASGEVVKPVLVMKS